MIDQAFIFAAGIGKRMRPLTDSIPKPMVEVLGKPVIDHILDHLAAAHIEKCVINAYHHADVLIAHLHGRAKDLPFEIIISRETQLLETGGGLKKALPLIDRDQPLYAINGDAFWIDAPHETTLSALAKNWDATSMDILLLLQPVETMVLTHGVGDYDFTRGAHIARNMTQAGTHMFAGTRILHPRIYDYKQWPDAYSFLAMMDAAQEKDRLLGMPHKGTWHHLSTPEDVHNVNGAT